MMIQEFCRQAYEEVCIQLPKGSREGNYSDAPESRPGNHPSDFDTLSKAEQAALLYWIRHAISGARTYDRDHSSYGIKHDFEQEGFYVTNGQFKGAMLLCGYQPKDIHALNWLFMIRKRHTRKPTRYDDTSISAWRYSLARFDKEFAELLVKAGYFKVSVSSEEQTYRRAYRDGWIQAVQAFHEAMMEGHLTREKAYDVVYDHYEQALDEWEEKAKQDENVGFEMPPLL